MIARHHIHTVVTMIEYAFYGFIAGLLCFGVALYIRRKLIEARYRDDARRAWEGLDKTTDKPICIRTGDPIHGTRIRVSRPD